MEIEQGLFHGGCVGCAQAKQGGTPVCCKCCFFECNWRLSDLNDKTKAEKEAKEKRRERLRAGMTGDGGTV